MDCIWYHFISNKMIANLCKLSIFMEKLLVMHSPNYNNASQLAQNGHAKIFYESEITSMKHAI